MNNAVDHFLRTTILGSSWHPEDTGTKWIKKTASKRRRSFFCWYLIIWF